MHTLGYNAAEIKGKIVATYRAKKHFGQNFLQDSHYLHKIIQSTPTLPIQCIEIGIGLGDLTQELLKIEPLIAYEVDLDLCSLLDKKFSSHIQSGRLKIIYENVLNLHQEQQWLYEQEYKVVSNLPYYIATHIIVRLLRDRFCRALLVMTQKEVAQKFCALSGESAFCALSVLTQTLGETQMLFDVPNSAFSPIPKVTSSVFVIHKHHLQTFEAFSLYGLESFLKSAFHAPRKTLLKNLSTAFDKKLLEKALESACVPFNARPHEVKTKSFHHILEILKKGHNNGRQEHTTGTK